MSDGERGTALQHRGERVAERGAEREEDRQDDAHPPILTGPGGRSGADTGRGPGFTPHAPLVNPVGRTRASGGSRAVPVAREACAVRDACAARAARAAPGRLSSAARRRTVTRGCGSNQI
ncbi:hypothetical protein GCM10018791_35930 [Streptomyces zaomyceticus]|nr:hypothetical protein GCM10018791_35930 [Streptomyces zaomyceticus]